MTRIAGLPSMRSGHVFSTPRSRMRTTSVPEPHAYVSRDELPSWLLDFVAGCGHPHAFCQ